MRRFLFTAVVAALSALPQLAAADTLGTLHYEGSDRRAIVTIAGIRSGSFYAGELKWSWEAGQPANLPDLIYTYCVDIAHNATTLQDVAVQSTDELDPPGDPDDHLTPHYVDNAGAKAAWLFNTYAPAVHAGGTNIEAAALQVAIWEALYDTTQDLTGGGFQLVLNSSTAHAIKLKANSYLSGLYYSGDAYHTSSALWLNSPIPGGQDQITNVFEPTTVLLLGLGTVVSLSRRRRLDAANLPI